MARTIAELRQRRSTLKADAKVILDAARTTGGELTDEQTTKLDAFNAELGQIETEMDALTDGLVSAADRDAAVTSARAEGHRAGLAQAGEIVALCTIAGKPQAAAAFLKDGKTADEVKASLAAEREPGREDLNPRRTPAAEADTRKAWGKAVDKVNARVPGGRAA